MSDKPTLSPAEQAKVNKLFKAAYGQDQSKIRELRKAGVDLDSRDPYSQKSPLDIAANLANFEIIETLLELGANVNAQDDQGKTCLLKISAEKSESVFEGYAKTAKLLLTHGANPNLADNNGAAPIHMAALYNNVSLAKELVAAGADVNIKEIIFNTTPLHYAASSMHESEWADREPIVNLLLSSGADVHARNERGDTPLHNASGSTISPLIAAGANINAVNNKQFSPLHNTLQTELPDDEKVALLLAAGADYTLIANDGNTASMIAHRRVDNYSHVQMAAAEYADQIQGFLRGTTTEIPNIAILNEGINRISYSMSNEIAGRMKEAYEENTTNCNEQIQKRIISLWNLRDLNNYSMLETNKVAERLASLEIDEELRSNILTGYKDKLTQLAYQKVKDKEVMIDILHELVPFMTYQPTKDMGTGEGAIPLPSSKEIFDLKVKKEGSEETSSFLPLYHREAHRLITDYAENPAELLHTIVTNKEISVDGRKLPTFEEILSRDDFPISNKVFIVQNVQRLKHRTIDPEIKEVVERVTNNILAIKLDQVQAKEAVNLFNPYINSVIEAESYSVNESSTPAEKYLHSASNVGKNFKDNPEKLFEYLVRGTGLPKILLDEAPEGVPPLYVETLATLEHSFGGAGASSAFSAHASGGASSVPANGGAGVGSHHDEDISMAGSASRAARHAAEDEDVAMGGLTIEEGGGSVGAKYVRHPSESRAPSPTPSERASAAARARVALTDHARDPGSASEVPHAQTQKPPREKRSNPNYGLEI